MADLADGPDGILQTEITEYDIVFKHLQQSRDGSYFHERCIFRHIRVPGYHMQATKPFGVRMGLIAGVDDGTAAGGCRGDALPDVLGSLGNAVDGATRCLQEFPGPREDLTGNQEGDQRLDDYREVTMPSDQVVLMASVRIAG